MFQGSTAHGRKKKKMEKKKKKKRIINKGVADAGQTNPIPMSHNSNTHKTPGRSAKATAIPTAATNASSNAQRGAESRAITAGITPASIDDVTISQAQLRWLHRMEIFSSRQHSVD